MNSVWFLRLLIIYISVYTYKVGWCQISQPMDSNMRGNKKESEVQSKGVVKIVI